MEQDCPHSFPSVFLPLGLDKALDCFSTSYPTPCGSFSAVIIIREPLPVAWLFSARVAPNVDVIFHVFMRGGGRILLLHHLDLPHPPASTFKGKYDKYACSLVRPLCLPASKTTLSDLQWQMFILRICTNRYSFPSLSERAYTGGCFSGCRDSGSRRPWTFTLSQPHLPLHMAVPLPHTPRVSYSCMFTYSQFRLTCNLVAHITQSNRMSNVTTRCACPNPWDPGSLLYMAKETLQVWLD